MMNLLIASIRYHLWLMKSADNNIMACDEFYKSKVWQKKRRHILARDKYMDQVLLRDGIMLEADTVHHIFPCEEYPQYRLCDWNLISVNNNVTHKGRLHQRFNGKLTKEGRLLMEEAAFKQGIKLKSLTLIVGLPGSGKSTLAKKLLQGGLCYEMDAIASAFRLTVPHMEEPHTGARRMAASLRRGWLQEARKYADNLIVVRTAPDVDELSETMPDKIIVCTKQYVTRPYRYDRDDYQRQLQGVVAWAKMNDVPVEMYPPR